MTGSYIVNLLTSKYPDVKFRGRANPGPRGRCVELCRWRYAGAHQGHRRGKEESRRLRRNFYMQPEQQVYHHRTESGMPPRTDLTERSLCRISTQRNLIAYHILANARTPYTFASDELFVSRTGPWLNLLNRAIFGEDVDGSLKTAQDEFTKILERTNP